MNDRDSGVREIVRLLIGLLLGAGLAGGAVKILGDPRAPFWPGMLILVFCVLSAAGLFVYGEWLIDRRSSHRSSLRRLGTNYVQVLNTMGQRLVDKLETVAAENRLRPDEMRGFILRTLADILSQASQGTGKAGDLEDWEKILQDSTATTVNEWRSLAAVEDKEGYFPSGAEPKRLEPHAPDGE